MTSLLEKEKEFHKLNEELEQRTRILMNEVDSVMKMQNNIASEAKEFVNSKYPENFRHERWESYEEIKRNTGVAIAKCLKTKITVQQNEMDELKCEYKNKCADLKQLHADLNKLEEERTKWQQLSNLYKEQKEKAFNQISSLNSKLQSKDTEILALKKENELLQKDLKSTNMSSSNHEQKFNKLLEENEKHKSSLKIVKQEEKDLRDSHKKQINELTNSNKKLEKQVTDLTNGFKKQMILVDNLKKQKVSYARSQMYLESAKLIQISEEEFSRMLDWKPSE